MHVHSITAKKSYRLYSVERSIKIKLSFFFFARIRRKKESWLDGLDRDRMNT